MTFKCFFNDNVRLPVLFEQHTLLLEFLPYTEFEHQWKGCGLLIQKLNRVVNCAIGLVLYEPVKVKNIKAGQKEIKIYRIIPWRWHY